MGNGVRIVIVPKIRLQKEKVRNNSDLYSNNCVFILLPRGQKCGQKLLIISFTLKKPAILLSHKKNCSDKCIAKFNTRFCVTGDGTCLFTNFDEYNASLI